MTNFRRKSKHHFRGLRQLLNVESIGHNHRMQTDPLNILFFCPSHGSKNLLLGHTVLGFFRMPNNIISVTDCAGIISKTNFFR